MDEVIEVTPRPPGAADLERLEEEIEEDLITLIDQSTDDPMIADLQRRKLHLLDEIERLRRQFGADARSAGTH
jgi:hypothetical protein